MNYIEHINLMFSTPSMLALTLKTVCLVATNAPTISAITNMVAAGSLASQALSTASSLTCAVSTGIWNWYATVPCNDAKYSPSEIQNIVIEMQKNAHLLALKMYSYVPGSVVIDFYYDNDEIKANIFFYPTLPINGKKNILLSVSMMQDMNADKVLNISRNGATVSKSAFESYQQCELKSFVEEDYQVILFDDEVENLLTEPVDEPDIYDTDLPVDDENHAFALQAGAIFYSHDVFCEKPESDFL